MTAFSSGERGRYTLVPRYLRGLSLLLESEIEGLEFEELDLELEELLELELDSVLLREKLGLGLCFMAVLFLFPILVIGGAEFLASVACFECWRV